MIGLGSNRLNVCRRGGMRVTQAGRGGMEWLAGGRLPSWASPYSAQATAALKAQFPTQWPTIRDYGVAHPEYIAAINFAAPQDPEIMYSLIAELGYKRWLQGDGLAYINSGYVVKATDRISIKGYMPNGGAPSTFFGWRWDGSFNDDYQAYLIFNNSPGLFMVGSTSKIGTNKNIPYGVDFEAIVDFKNHIRQYKYSGTIVDDSATADFVNPISQNTPAYVMGFNIKGTAYGYPPVGKMYEADLTGWHGIPCKHNGQSGMVDLISATWEGNANSSGSFTISETPAS